MKATVKKIKKLDANGNRKWQYNFYDEAGNNINDLFKNFGRVTKNGLNSQLEPREMVKHMYNESHSLSSDLIPWQRLRKIQAAIKREEKNGTSYQLDIYGNEHTRELGNLSLVKDLIERINKNGFEEL